MSLTTKIAAFGLAAAAMTSTASAQAVGELIAPRPTPGDTVAPPRQEIKEEKPDNGYYAFSVGALCSSASSLWNKGCQFHWEGIVPIGGQGSWLHRYTQFRAGYTMRNKSIGSRFAFKTPQGSVASAFYYKPNEVNAAATVGIPIVKGNDEYNTVVVRPFAGVGGSWGFGGAVNDAGFASPELVSGADIMLGRIAIVKRGQDRKQKTYVPTIAFHARAEFVRQFLNNNDLARFAFPPNEGPNNRTALRATAALSVGFP